MTLCIITVFRFLRKAYERSSHKESVEYQAFLEENEEWLDDYALYMAVKGNMKEKAGWTGTRTFGSAVQRRFRHAAKSWQKK